MDKKCSYALTFVLKDRAGIVAEVTKVLFENGFNIADSSSTLLQGIFSMILLVEHPNRYTEDDIKTFFASGTLNPSVYITDDAQENAENTDEHFIISVYGADKPGIVHNITVTLAELGINIIDLQTQIVGAPPKEVYIMVLEVLVPDKVAEQNWLPALKEKATAIGTDISVRKLETFKL